MIVFRYAWIVALAAIAGHTLSACVATSPKEYPEKGWPTLRLARPAWLHKPTLELDVRWVRERGEAQVQNGVCVLHLADDVERSLNQAEEQVAACVKTGALLLPEKPPAGAVRLHWHQQPSVDAVTLRWRQLFQVGSFPLAGFYYHPNASGACHVVTSTAHEALGHEIKHCFDGEFHASGNRWLAHSTTRHANYGVRHAR